MSTVATKKTIKKAMQDGLNKFNFDKKVIATQDFGYHTPVECKLVIPRDKFEINIEQFTRLMPLPCPTYGKIESVTRAFFVPMHQLFKDWENFISNRKTPYHAFADSDGLREAHVPYFNVYQLSCMLLSSAWSTEVTSTDAHDIVAVDLSDSTGNTFKYYKVSAVLRHVITWLNGLGYNFPWCVDSANVSSGAHDGWQELASSYTNADYIEIFNTRLSALPLVAYWKFYLDWCVPSRYIRDGWIRQYTLLDGLYKCDRRLFVSTNDSALNSPNDYHLNSGTVYRLVSSLPVSYFADDYFSQAFKSPFGNEDSLSNSIVIPTPMSSVSNTFKDVSDTFSNGTNVGPYIPSSGNIQQFSLQSLGALQDLVNRGKLAGNKIQDYLRVTYGITPSNDAMNVSTYLGCHRFDIKIGDVMSNADTKNGSDGAYLGEYAGRGLGGDSCKFTFEAKEHGFFFITNELYVKPSYIQGLRPEVTALDRFDFFQPEFDNMGVDAIDTRELTFTPINYATTEADDVVQKNSVSVFGFTPRYGKLKTNYDAVLGDFRFGRVNAGLDSWYLSRMYNKANALQWQNGINYTFPWQYGSTGDNYDRIFQVANQTIDHFYTVFHLDFTAMRAMKSLTTPFEVEENHGDDVIVETQGLV